ncbi:nucleotidyltransferase family protein [Roseibacterium sp. SDUM158017]|uniref:nucleotidyltransferase family protein n=1 Tax=Roseicyclus salinarum TaxID=3036773 RepID=UPI0024157A38|nr:nucleotidyltransferase family protein [Roseibacterium sp. SDUM158017]MDG4649615.1 nucleotidyltransferase family protein [Roseibacterium sp. SDUM158017]
MADVKALLLAGGLGTRLRPLTETVPKCLIPVAGKPMLDYWLDALEAAGIGEALLNTHHLRDAVKAWIDAANASRDVQVTEAYEPELLGSAGTVTANRGWADDAEAILVIYADNLSTIDLSTFLAFHRSHDDPMSMALFHAPNPKACGIATLDVAGVITAFTEKPDTPQSDLANAGLYVLDAAAWREIADMGAFDFGFDVLPRFVGRMRGYVHPGYHRDVGTPAALAAAEADAPALFGNTP